MYNNPALFHQPPDMKCERGAKKVSARRKERTNEKRALQAMKEGKKRGEIELFGTDFFAFFWTKGAFFVRVLMYF